MQYYKITYLTHTMMYSTSECLSLHSTRKRKKEKSKPIYMFICWKKNNLKDVIFTITNDGCYPGSIEPRKMHYTVFPDKTTMVI